MDHATTLGISESKRNASTVFPVLLAPEDAGRPYPLWPTEQKSSARTFLSRLFRAMLGRSSAAQRSRPLSEQRSAVKANPERGSGSW
jgi:hypothetical protein